MRATLLLALSLGPLSVAFSQQPVPYFTEPSVAPNRAEIAFVSGGDIWTAPLSGGEAHLLVSHPATEGRPIYSPDGTRLAFVSNRSGERNLYLLDLATSSIRRLTFDDSSEQLDAWSRDGKYLYFSTTAHDIAGMSDVYRISVDGGLPVPVTADRYVSEFFSAPSPTGDTLAFTARGVTFAQWWRRGHSHLDESEIWLAALSPAPKYEKFAAGDFKCAWPMWSADGARLWYMSDQGGTENIWEKPVKGGAPRQITRFQDGRLLWPSVSYDGKTIVFERDFRIWKLDTASGKAAPVDLVLRGAPAGPEVTHLSASSGLRDLALSPDGKKLAFAVHGEIFAASAKDGGPAARVTRTTADETATAWAPDNKRIAYVSNRDGAYRIYLYDFSTSAESRLTAATDDETAPVWSPDGKLLAFVANFKTLCVYDAASKQVRTLATGHFGRPPFASNRFMAWSPDNRWIAYAASGERGFENLFAVPAAGGTPKQITFLSNSNSGSVLWAPDGTYILLDTNQRTEENRIARVDLVPRAPRFREDRFRDLFKESAPTSQSAPPPADTAAKPAPAEQKADAPKPAAATPKPVEIVFEGIRNRLSLVETGLNARLQRISPDGKTLLISASVATQPNYYTLPLDELATESRIARQVTFTGANKSGASFTPDGKEFYYLEQGRINIATVESHTSRALSVTVDMDVRFDLEKPEVFAEAWRYVNDNFFDPKFNGVDWKAMRERYAPHAAGARTPDELRRVISLMLGELNASHMGIGLANSDPHVGKLGLRFDAAEYLNSGKFRVSEVVPLGPAALSGGIKSGDELLSIDGVPLTPRSNPDEILDHKIGARVALSLAAAAGKREVAVRPVSTTNEKSLTYKRWVQEQRTYVSKVSGGRLGYVHLPDMSSEALENLYLDLDSENQAREGVVVDIRNNNGGFVNVYAIDVLSRRGYLKFTERDDSPVPARAALGQRTLERPTILVVNRFSLSDAEDFTEGYRALKLGKVVGEPTAGWIVFTSSTNLIDGSTLRLPGTRVTTADGSPMELAPRPVDVAVDKPVGEAGKDSQLDTAVRELLRQLDAPAR